jgi:DHA1 family bicyclomycin/chloramphenicol resistance-like MFS transporter
MLKPGSFGLTLLLGLLAAMTALSIDMSLPTLPTITAVFGTTPDRAQLTLSLFLVGFSLGQLILGPVSDRFGRRPTLLAGPVLFTLTAFSCAFARNIEMLLLARLAQGFAACTGPVVSRAAIRDHHGGRRAAEMLSYITIVIGVAPLLAPLIGGALLTRFGWPAIFLCLAAFGLTLTVATVWGFAESLKAPDLRALRLDRLVANYRRFFGNRRCLGFALVNACVFGGLFSYISGSPFVLIEVYGVRSDHYGFYFGGAALALMAGALLNTRLVRRLPSERLLRLGLAILMVAGLALVPIAWLRLGGPLTLMLPIMVYVFAQGLVLPNAVAATMEPLPEMAGVAASLLGAIQMIGGSIVGYAVDALYDGTPRSMAGMIAVMGSAAFATYHLLIARLPRPT